MSKIKSLIARRGGKRLVGLLAAAVAGWVASRSPELVALLGGQEHLAAEIVELLGGLRDILWALISSLVLAALETRAPKDHPA